MCSDSRRLSPIHFTPPADITTRPSSCVVSGGVKWLLYIDTSRSVQFAVMLGVDVPSEVDPALERPAASVARERLESLMLSTVRDQVRRLTKGLATLTTNVRFLACDTNKETSARFSFYCTAFIYTATNSRRLLRGRTDRFSTI